MGGVIGKEEERRAKGKENGKRIGWGKDEGGGERSDGNGNRKKRKTGQKFME